MVIFCHTFVRKRNDSLVTENNVYASPQTTCQLFLRKLLLGDIFDNYIEDSVICIVLLCCNSRTALEYT